MLFVTWYSHYSHFDPTAGLYLPSEFILQLILPSVYFAGATEAAAVTGSELSTELEKQDPHHLKGLVYTWQPLNLHYS